MTASEAVSNDSRYPYAADSRSGCPWTFRFSPHGGGQPDRVLLCAKVRSAAGARRPVTSGRSARVHLSSPLRPGRHYPAEVVQWPGPRREPPDPAGFYYPKRTRPCPNLSFPSKRVSELRTRPKPGNCARAAGEGKGGAVTVSCGGCRAPTRAGPALTAAVREAAGRRRLARRGREDAGDGAGGSGSRGGPRRAPTTRWAAWAPP